MAQRKKLYELVKATWMNAMEEMLLTKNQVDYQQILLRQAKIVSKMYK